MSKIGRKAIPFSSAKVEIGNGFVKISGAKGTLTHELPACLSAKQEDKKLFIICENPSRQDKILWGLTRATIANKIIGMEKGFEVVLQIVGLGFKAQISGKKIVFTLGFSHKIDFDIPAGIEVAADKTGQLLTLKSADKELLGKTTDAIRCLRPSEPYKGTGIMKVGEQIRRKAGKTKAAAA